MDQTETAAEPLTNKELAARISRYLRKFEADRDGANRPRRYDRETSTWVDDPNGSGSYYGASCSFHSGRIYVTYVSYQHSTVLWSASSRVPGPKGLRDPGRAPVRRVRDAVPPPLDDAATRGGG